MNFTFRFSIWLLLLLTFVFGAKSQSLIVGIPSADVCPLGKFEITHESQLKSSPFAKEWNSFNILCYGISKSVEVTLVANNLNSVSLNEFALGLGIKKVFNLLESKELKLTTGINGLGGTINKNVGYWAYSHLSARIPKLKTRLSAGVHQGTEHALGFKTYLQGNDLQRSAIREFGYMLAIEQPLFNNFSFIADWISGNTSLSAFIPAIQFDFGHQVFIAGYKFPNHDSSNQAFILEVMLEF